MHWVPGRGGVPKTQDNQERRARLHIIPHLGQLPLRNITAADLRAHIAKLESTVSSVDYQRGILSELSSILEGAVDDKRLLGTHARGIRAVAQGVTGATRGLAVGEGAASPRRHHPAQPDNRRPRSGMRAPSGRGVRIEPGGHRLRERRASCPPPSTSDQGEAVLRPAEGEEDPCRRHALLGGRGAQAVMSRRFRR
ncbi:hypothetical protein [Streptomyces coeruleorubidus]|uniref:hypothetical protein n=1 Tax=Streptomyces coeruleorubidus TaxID=116188 RepID=UPI0033C566D1